jgi:hypothetical protein
MQQQSNQGAAGSRPLGAACGQARMPGRGRERRERPRGARWRRRPVSRAERRGGSGGIGARGGAEPLHARERERLPRALGALHPLLPVRARAPPSRQPRHTTQRPASLALPRPHAGGAGRSTHTGREPGGAAQEWKARTGRRAQQQASHAPRAALRTAGSSRRRHRSRCGAASAPPRAPARPGTAVSALGPARGLGQGRVIHLHMECVAQEAGVRGAELSHPRAHSPRTHGPCWAG